MLIPSPSDSEVQLTAGFVRRLSAPVSCVLCPVSCVGRVMESFIGAMGPVLALYFTTLHYTALHFRGILVAMVMDPFSRKMWKLGFKCHFYNFRAFGSNFRYVINFEQALFWNYGLQFCISAISVSRRHSAKIQFVMTFHHNLIFYSPESFNKHLHLPSNVKQRAKKM